MPHKNGAYGELMRAFIAAYPSVQAARRGLAEYARGTAFAIRDEKLTDCQRIFCQNLRRIALDAIRLFT